MNKNKPELVSDESLDKLIDKFGDMNCPYCGKTDMEYTGLLSTDFGDDSHLSYFCKCNCIVNIPYIRGDKK